MSCDNRYIGALFFSVALLCICYLGYYLYTGKISSLANDCSLQNIKSLFIGLAMNLIITFLLGLLIKFALPLLAEKSLVICNEKLKQSFVVTFIRAIFCGVLMYLAVEIFKKEKNPIGIIFCIPVFILSGFEHSIADMFYFGLSGLKNPGIISFEISAVLGNTVGSLIIPLLSKVGNKNVKNNS